MKTVFIKSLCLILLILAAGTTDLYAVGHDDR